MVVKELTLGKRHVTRDKDGTLKQWSAGIVPTKGVEEWKASPGCFVILYDDDEDIPINTFDCVKWEDANPTVMDCILRLIK